MAHRVNDVAQCVCESLVLAKDWQDWRIFFSTRLFAILEGEVSGDFGVCLGTSPGR